MLLTRCPECDTTFRVTDDALKSANGQVRCGRCASVFNAYAELRQAPSETAEAEGDAASSAAADDAAGATVAPSAAPPLDAAAPLAPDAAPESAALEPLDAERLPATEAPAEDASRETTATSPATAERDASSQDEAAPGGASALEPVLPALSPTPNDVAATGLDECAEPTAPPPAGDSTPVVAPAAAAQEPAAPAAPPEPAAPMELFEADEQRAIGPGAPRGGPTDNRLDALLATVVAQVDSGGAVADAHGDAGATVVPEPDAITADQVDAVLGGEPERGTVATETREPRWARASQRRSSGARWTAGCVVCVAVLALQTVNHFRAELIGHSTLGPLLQNAYAMLGITVTPRWDVHQYSILDWVASAAPNSRGQGSLKISARIQNRGPQSQPYPSVQLRLKDRWETAVAMRVFSPSEYLAAGATRAHALMAPGETTRAELVVVDPGPDAYGFELDVCIEVEAHSLSCGSDKVFL